MYIYIPSHHVPIISLFCPMVFALSYHLAGWKHYTIIINPQKSSDILGFHYIMIGFSTLFQHAHYVLKYSNLFQVTTDMFLFAKGLHSNKHKIGSISPYTSYITCSSQFLGFTTFFCRGDPKICPLI